MKPGFIVVCQNSVVWEIAASFVFCTLLFFAPVVLLHYYFFYRLLLFCFKFFIVAIWHPFCEEMEREWGNEEEIEREWGNDEELEWDQLLNISSFPPSLSTSFIKICHILLQNVKFGTFVANVTKILTYALWGNNSGSNLLRGSSASFAGLLLEIWKTELNCCRRATLNKMLRASKLWDFQQKCDESKPDYWGLGNTMSIGGFLLSRKRRREPAD